MNPTTLKDFLVSIIAEALADAATDELPHAVRSEGAARNLPHLAERIADELVSEALASGLPLTRHKVEKSRLGGGNTAEIVAQLTLHAPFAFKFDQGTRKLAQEGETMRRIKENKIPGMDLPERFRNAWAQIYSVRHDPPFAYLMEFFPKEEGWLSLQDRLYPGVNGESPNSSDATRWISATLDILFSGYEASVDSRHFPNLMTDYFDRIRERMESTAKLNSQFAPRPLLINGQRLRPWDQYLLEIERNYSFLDEITPPFRTIAHGDPNPGNIMLRTTTSEVEVKLIDPKDWTTGDYLFDIAKLTHFLEGTGPVENPTELLPPRAAFSSNQGEEKLDYGFGKPLWTQTLVGICRERVRQFASRSGSKDPHWQARYELAMAANLLGLPEGRLKGSQPREHAAAVLFGEGLLWLDRFCSRLSVAWSYKQPVEAPNVIEPEPLRKVREWVRGHVVGVREAKDRRGFQMLHWDASNQQQTGKLHELSLEHEARLMPGDGKVVMDLLDALLRNEGKPAHEQFLRGTEKDSPELAGLIVRRYERAHGPQSIDRYYEVTEGGEAAALIPRMITVRERLRTSEFMSWSTADSNMHPLNLELPFVSLGHSGVTARLEFNWIGNLQDEWQEAFNQTTEEMIPCRNPLYITMQTQGITLSNLMPVIEHTTFRQKFGLWRPSNGPLDERELFSINIDTVIAQDLESRLIGTYSDVDVSSLERVDDEVLQQLISLTENIVVRYNLRPNLSTKAWRDIQVAGRTDILSTS